MTERGCILHVYCRCPSERAQRPLHYPGDETLAETEDFTGRGSVLLRIAMRKSTSLALHPLYVGKDHGAACYSLRSSCPAWASRRRSTQSSLAMRKYYRPSPPMGRFSAHVNERQQTIRYELSYQSLEGNVQ